MAINKISTDDLNNVKKITAQPDVIKMILEKLSEDIIWDYDGNTGELIITKRPSSYTEALMDLGGKMWRNAGGSEYIEEMREEWDTKH